MTNTQIIAKVCLSMLYKVQIDP